jgi:transcriptional regulatory protein RtcR
LWTFALPGLADRREDIAPNLDYELDRHAEREGERVMFNKEARERYLAFAMSSAARWPGNFRDLAASVTRMATFSPKGRIDSDVVATEIARLQRLWSTGAAGDDGLDALLDAEALAAIDPFDRVQLAHVVAECRASRSLSEAGRRLFAASRTRRASTNDADRLRKYLVRFGLEWDQVSGHA